MPKNKKLCFAVSALTCGMILGAAAITVNGTPRHLSADECSHSSVEVYEAVAPTLSSVGHVKHYACCGCHTAWSDEAKTVVIGNTVTDRSKIDLAKKTNAVEITKDEVGDDKITTIYEASDKVKGLDQTDWSQTSNGKGPGTFHFYEVDGRKAVRVSAENVTDEQRALIETSNSGYSEWRFKNTLSNVKQVSFDYKIYDLNPNDVFKTEAHFNTQLYNGTYTTLGYELINDNQWHTAVINASAAQDITYNTMKIQHFKGEMYISNLQYEHEHVYDAYNMCTECGAVNLLKSTNMLVNSAALSETTNDAPKGFSKVYHYSAAVGGGENSNTLFTSNLGLWSFKRFQYAVKVKANRQFYVQIIGVGALNLPVPTVDTWVNIVASKNADGTWTITNDLGNFGGKGSAPSYTFTPTVSRVNGIFVPRYQDEADLGFDITEILAFSSSKKHVHSGEGACTGCGYTALNYSDIAWNPEQIVATSMDAPEGFQTLYRATGTDNANGGMGGGTSNCFIKHTATGMSALSEMKIAFRVDGSTNLRLLVATEQGGSNQQIAFPSLNWAAKCNYVTVTFTRSGDQWVATNDAGNWGTGSASVTIYPSYGNYYFYAARFISGTGFYCTELLVK